MTTQPVALVLREAASAVPRARWSRSGATVEIPETEDWAGKALSISGLHRPVARAYARHIAAACPANVLDLLDQRDDLLAQAEKHLAWLSQLTDWAGVGDPDVDGLIAAIAKAKGARS